MTIDELEPLSDEWFDAALDGVDQILPDKVAARTICRAFEITGQADPGYIANVINSRALLSLIWYELEHRRQLKDKFKKRGEEFGLRLAQAVVADHAGFKNRAEAVADHLKICKQCAGADTSHGKLHPCA